MKYPLNIFWALLVCGFTFLSCKKETFNNSPDARLYTSKDSIKFDTVFTSAGSVTKSFKIFNNNNQKLLLSSVKLMGGSTSAFLINVNGVAATEVNNIEIAANDSIYVFVSAFINPTTGNLPFIVSDSILIQYNTNNRYVQLEAYGQNANYLVHEVITGNRVWTNGVPYVILGSLRIDTSASLTISAGSSIYVHAGAPILVDGSLIVSGEKNNEVQFAGNRLDEYYRDLPGSWPGIFFRGSSKDNELQYAIVKNAYQAIVVQEPSINNNPKLSLRQCIINNALDAGIIGINTGISAENSLISNCGRNIILQAGGVYSFIHCTAATFSNTFINHNKPVLTTTNYSIINGVPVSNNLSAIFRNSIFWGSEGLVDDEVVVDKSGNTVFDVQFDHCLYRASSDPANSILSAIIKNENPVFDSIDIFNRYFDFRTNSPFSPGSDQGVTTSLLKDLDDNPRNIGIPDLGCYEKQ